MARSAILPTRQPAGYSPRVKRPQRAPRAGTSPPSEIADLAAFLRSLEASGRFNRDNAVGRVFHPGAVSYRETVAEDSVHIVVEDGRVTAHVDRYSPVRFTKDGVARYAFFRITVHNVAGRSRTCSASRAASTAASGARRPARPSRSTPA